MKKILLSFSFFCLLTSSKSQTVLNEVYLEPNGSTKEFFELYYSGSNPLGENVDCWTVVTYWESGANEGWYVMDLPAGTVSPTDRYYVGSSSNPFTAQGSATKVPDFSWNTMPVTGRLTKWQRNGAGYTDVSASIPAGTFNDFMPLKGGGGAAYIILVFRNGALNNGFLGGTTSNVLPAAIANLPDLSVDMLGSCSDFTIDFSVLGAMENGQGNAGSDNGYNRSADGKCGAWEKSSSSAEHTPGATNGTASALTGSLTTSQLIQCNTTPTSSTVLYNITALSGSATEADDFPVEVQLYYDYGTIGQLDGADLYQSSLFDAAVADGAKTFSITTTQPVIVIYKTKRGCFDKVIAITNSCISLPVDFKSFTAARNRSNVLLKWETTSEQNNRGFAVERNTGNNIWQEVAFVPTQAAGGNSASLLSYQYVDFNEAKSMTQYRVRQVDLDNRSKYTQVRSIRGLDQGNGIIVYPNPTTDGKINVVFEEANSIRNISVVDMSGKTIKQMVGISSNSIVIDNLNPGMYTLRVVVPATGEQTIQKIVVNKR
jgi:Secretion system C-terminal sorting domain